MSLKIKKKFNAFNETLATKAKKIIEEEMPQKVNILQIIIYLIIKTL